MPLIKSQELNSIALGSSVTQGAYSTGDKFGANTDVGSSYEDIWDVGGTITYLTSASTITCTTTGNDNGVASTGARKVTIQGLDSDYNEVSATLTTNATTPQVTSQTFLRVNRAFVTEVGSGGVNENDIVLTATTGGSTQATIVAGAGQSQKTQYTVPSGYKAYIQVWRIGCDKGKDITVQLLTRLYNTSSTNSYESFRVQKEISLYESAIEVVFTHFIQCPEKTDIKIRGKASAAGNAFITASYEFYLVKQ